MIFRFKRNQTMHLINLKKINAQTLYSKNDCRYLRHLSLLLMLTCSKRVILYNLITQYAGSVFISVRWSTVWISFFKCYAWILCWKMHVISKFSPDYKLGIYWVGQGQLKMIPEEICTVITFLALKFEHHSIHQLN